MSRSKKYRLKFTGCHAHASIDKLKHFVEETEARSPEEAYENLQAGRTSSKRAYRNIIFLQIEELNTHGN